MPDPKKSTLVAGASDNPSRYSFLAINSLRRKGHPVFALGRTPSRVADVTISPEKPLIEGLDTITLYLSPVNQRNYYDYFFSLHPRRIIFNPGAENKELADMARSHGIEVLEACTLVLLSTGQY